MRGPLRGACSEGERCEDYGCQTGTTFWDIVSASFHGRLLPPAAPQCLPARPPGPAPHDNVGRFPKDAPVLQHQQRRYQAGPTRATCNWRHRISADHGETGGKFTRYNELAHAGRDSVHLRPRRAPESFFSAIRLIRGLLRHLLPLQP